MANTFGWIEIRTHPLDPTAGFLASLFGWKIFALESVVGSPSQIFDTCGEPRIENLPRGGGAWVKVPLAACPGSTRKRVIRRKVPGKSGITSRPHIRPGTNWHGELMDVGCLTPTKLGHQAASIAWKSIML
jgi:hypothetical protein